MKQIQVNMNCICKDHRNKREAPDSVVKDLIIYKKKMKQFDKKSKADSWYGSDYICRISNISKYIQYFEITAFRL